MNSASPYEAKVASAHRSPELVAEYTKSAEERGLEVMIGAAGLAAHLAGVVASMTLLPVLGVPMQGNAVGGLDALLAMAQMPGGVPVGTLAIGSHGAKNAALLGDSHSREFAAGAAAEASRISRRMAKQMANDHCSNVADQSYPEGAWRPKDLPVLSAERLQS